jgi:hypothetical protein
MSKNKPWMSIRNKLMGRDLTYDKIKSIAINYKSRGEFQTKDGSAYQTARRKGWLNEICQHMAIINFSIPQLILKNILDDLLKSESHYNTRKIIPPYEIDIYYAKFNLAIEYNGKGWHINNQRDIIKKKILLEKNINIIYIAERNRDYEKDIKTQLIENLDKINFICKIKLTSEMITNCRIKNVYDQLYNKNDILNIAKKYLSLKEFREKEKSIYSIILKMKLLNEATSHMERLTTKYETDEIIKEKIKNYKTLKELINTQWKVYQYIKRHNKEYLISHLHRQNYYATWTMDQIKETINKYSTRNNFAKHNRGLYSFIRKKKMLYLLDNIRERKVYNIKKVL